MWLKIKRWSLIFLVAISFLGMAGCETKPQINKPAIVQVELIGNHPKTITGAYLFRFERKAQPQKGEPQKGEPQKGGNSQKPDTFNLGRSVEKLFLKDWNVQAPPELKVEKKEPKVSLVEAGAYELKPTLTIAATPETASQYFKQSIVVEFPSIVGIAKFLNANIPVCPPTPKIASSPDNSPKAIISPSPTSTESPSPSPTPTESASPSPTSTESPSPSPTTTESASPSPTTTESASPSPTPTESASPSPTPTESASPSPTPTEQASPSPTNTPQEGVVNVNPDRTPKEASVPTCVPKVEFQITHYSSYSQLGFDNIGINFLGIVGCALFVALMVWFLSDKWDIVFEHILYILAAVSLYAVGVLGIPFFLFQTLKNIGWILSGLLGG